MTPGQYLGADATLHFGDPVAELAALRESCGAFHLPWRAKIAVTGKDRARWLHNMVTNNVRDLALNRGNYNFVLNAQGRILGDMYIYNRGESLVLDTDRTQVEPLLTAMKRYIIMDKVEMNVAPITAWAICGPKCKEKLAPAGIDVKSVDLKNVDLKNMEPLELRELPEGRGILVRGPVNKPDWYEFWVTGNDDSDFNLAAIPGWTGIQPVGTQALEWWRILHGIPQYGQDIRDRDLPQETGQTQALNFDKGCYIGQEIVERIRSRGHVHRKFTGFEFEDELPALGKDESGGRGLAEVTSVATVPTAAGEKKIGLGYVRHEVAEAGPHVDLKGHKAKIVELPFAM
jgi:folate-binding protein YgfZ